jgi:hypothetical protein
LEIARNHNKGKTVVKMMNEYEDQVAEEQLYKVKLFQYPDWQKPSAIFDFEDLDNEEVLLVLCARSKPGDEMRKEDTVFVWHGNEHDVSQEEAKEFVQKCAGVYYDKQTMQGLKVMQEHSGDEGSEFMQFFE